MSKRHKWACPRCGTTASGRHGKGGVAACQYDRGGKSCNGFICECDSHGGGDHGQSHDDPCPRATCYHCGWGGTYPVPPLNLKGWARKAWDAGWRPPAGWSPDGGAR